MRLRTLHTMLPRRFRPRYFATFLVIGQIAIIVFLVRFFGAKNESWISRSNIMNVNIAIEKPDTKTQKRPPSTSSTNLQPEDELNAADHLRSDVGFSMQDLTLKITEGLARGLEINFKDKRTDQYTFTYTDLPIPPEIEDLERRAGQPRKPFNKYVFVHSDYTEQMSMSMLSLLSLCGQAHFGGRKVVKPFIHNSRFVGRETSNSLGILFDLEYLETLLDQSGYSPLVDKQEYDAACKPSDPNHVSIHFLYIGGVTKKWNLAHLKITSEYYDSVFEKTKLKGWTECSLLDEKMRRAPSAKQFCINPTVITNWKVLEREIIGDEKCLNIFLWRGIGGGDYRSYFTEDGLRFPHDAVQFALKPSKPIQNEVERFRKAFLPDRYIAVYLRAELILIPHKYDFEYLKKCLDVIVQVTNALMATSGISYVYVASDMSKHGSASLINYVGKAKLGHNPFPEIHRSFVSQVDGVVYNHNASVSEIKDRGAIALVDLTILTHAQYLITAGREDMSSFLRWVIGSFLGNRRDDQELWSKISVCGH